MNITIAKVAALNPCNDRFKNFTDNNPNFSGKLSKFLSLDNITYSDKIWVCTRLMTRNQKFRFAVACAASVLHIYQDKYPNNNRVSDLIEFMKTIPDIDKMSEETRNKLISLRNAAYAAYADAYAAYAANAAAYAACAANAAAYAADAADAADAAADAAYAAAYAADADAAYAAADAAYAAAYAAVYAAAHEKQQNLNLILLVEIMEMD